MENKNRKQHDVDEHQRTRVAGLKRKTFQILDQDGDHQPACELCGLHSSAPPAVFCLPRILTWPPSPEEKEADEDRAPELRDAELSEHSLCFSSSSLRSHRARAAQPPSSPHGTCSAAGGNDAPGLTAVPQNFRDGRGGLRRLAEASVLLPELKKLKT